MSDAIFLWKTQDGFVCLYRNHQRFRQEAIAPIQNKVGQLATNPVLRNVVGQVKKKLDLPFIMESGRIFIANLSKGKLGHDKTGLLGSLLVSQFQLAAMARSNQPEDERRDFFLFVDEFQNFITDAFSSMLSEARKYRLCLPRAIHRPAGGGGGQTGAMAQEWRVTVFRVAAEFVILNSGNPRCRRARAVSLKPVSIPRPVSPDNPIPLSHEHRRNPAR